MYESVFGFNATPFQLTPDSRFFYGSSGHTRAIAHLVFGLSQEEGFIVITGEVGAGKTTLVDQLWTRLDRNDYAIARIVTTRVSGDDLLRLVVAGFSAPPPPGADKAMLLAAFEAALRSHRAAGRRPLLVVDEVQNLSLAALEELRMLSNITLDGKASIQTLLLGQPQFRATMASPDMEQLRQRVLASYHLGPLDAEETRAYVSHRLARVGWGAYGTYDPEIEDAAFAALHVATGGIPRRINTLMGRVLLGAALAEQHRIDAALVEETAQEWRQDLGTAPTVEEVTGTLPSGTSDRLARLEAGFARQERIFRRLLALLSGVEGRGDGGET